MNTADDTETARRVRAATSRDAAAFIRIYAPVVHDTVISFEVEPPSVAEMENRIRRTMEDDPWLVLERGDRIAGYAYATTFRDRPAYRHTRETTVYVDPDHHRSGVATLLMRSLLDDLVARGHHTAVAGVTLPNAASVALHERLGFRHVGTFSEVGHKFGRWHDVGFWERPLGG